MRTTQILATSILIGAVLLSGTACTANSTPEKTATASSQLSKEQSQTNDDTSKILTTVNGYYSFISNPETYDKVKTAGADLTGVQANDEQLKTLASDFSEGFQYFDTSDSQAIRNAYKAMMIGSSSLRMGSSVGITAPADAVTVDDDKATVNTTWIKVVKNGKELPVQPESNPDSSDLINLVKQEDGTWVIVAKDSSTKLTSP